MIVILVAFLVSFFLFKKDKTDYQYFAYNYKGNQVDIVFYGEKRNKDIFDKGLKLTDIVYPKNETGQRTGEVFENDSTWLHFSYAINGEKKEVLISKKPLMSRISWEDIARVGAALGDGSKVLIDDVSYSQNATIRDKDGRLYKVRLLSCGQGTFDNLSEWNLLIGGVHKGDIDFNSDDFKNVFNWAREPYQDKDLFVGHEGSLNWCMDKWKDFPEHKVLRGYFFVSRWHVALKNISTDRIFWRPVLELIDSSNDKFSSSLLKEKPLKEREEIRLSFEEPSVDFFGEFKNENLFEEDFEIAKYLNLYSGRYLEKNFPNWLHFEIDGKEVLVAKKPIKYSLSWEDIARVGAALGDGSKVLIDDVSYSQNATVKDKNGKLYRVRLLSCGNRTLDNLSEWNLLIGGVHKGDYNFNSLSNDIFSRFYPLYSDKELNLGFLNENIKGLSSWCKEREIIDNFPYATNRGFLVVSRFHLTETSFSGIGFGWRPVLELIK